MEHNENISSTDQLIIGYLMETLTAAQQEELIAWIKQDKANKRYFDELSEIWITSRAFDENKGLGYKKGFEKFKTKIEKSPSSRFTVKLVYPTVIRYAAIFILAFSLGGILFYYMGTRQTSYPVAAVNQIVVPFGGKAEFTLFDGTRVTLNAGSRLRYSNGYGINDRIVQLEGEAYFKVAKDKVRPFVVKTTHVSVRALGTEFNVKAYVDDKTIETTLVEGSVNVEQKTGADKSENLILKPNQKLTYFKEEFNAIVNTKTNKKTDKLTNSSEKEPDTKLVIVSENIDVAPMISWKENRWIIEKQDLKELAIELERKFDVHIHFESERLKTFRFTGTLLAEPIEQVLTVMSVSAPITYKIKGKDVTLSEGSDFETVYKSLYLEKNNK